MKTLLLALFLGLSAAVRSDAAIINIDLTGVAGNGLLTGNSPVAGTGSGGEIGAGITFNDVTSVLTVNVGWGSANGFTDLSSSVTDQHIHGPTANNYGNGYTQTAGVSFPLTHTSTSASSGTISNIVTLTAAQATNLYNGKFYLNIHTALNGGGEIRGFLVPVPQLGVAVTNAQANLTVSSVVGQKQIIQVSTNLPTWTSVATNASGTNVFQYSESNPQFPKRFYRAIVLP